MSKVNLKHPKRVNSERKPNTKKWATVFRVVFFSREIKCRRDFEAIATLVKHLWQIEQHL